MYMYQMRRVFEWLHELHTQILGCVRACLSSIAYASENPCYIDIQIPDVSAAYIMYHESIYACTYAYFKKIDDVVNKHQIEKNRIMDQTCVNRNDYKITIHSINHCACGTPG